MIENGFIASWRRDKCKAFDLEHNSTAGATKVINLWGMPIRVYANANLSIYSAQDCNANCGFCVEELRPASRGTSLDVQKTKETDDSRYFELLADVLAQLKPLNPSVSITGGEPSKDRRLPRILKLLSEAQARKLTITTNGAGLLDRIDGKQVIDRLTDAGVKHLNISRAHYEQNCTDKLMDCTEIPDPDRLCEIVRRARKHKTRVRLSCVLLKEAVNDLDSIIEYLQFAESMGIDNVVFRQLMLADPATVVPGPVVSYSDRQRVMLDPILDCISGDERFSFTKQVVGYYYYVEVWRYRSIDVVFEEADLRQLELVKQSSPEIVHELVFHPNGNLASTWQPWDGILGPVLI